MRLAEVIQYVVFHSILITHFDEYFMTYSLSSDNVSHKIYAPMYDVVHTIRHLIKLNKIVHSFTIYLKEHVFSNSPMHAYILGANWSK